MARRISRFVRPPARTMVWIGAGFTGANVGASSATLLGILNAAALALRPFTVIRTRLMQSWASDQLSASETVAGAFGIIVAKEQATTAGIVSLPDPITEPDAEWFVYQGCEDKFLFSSAVAFLSGVGHQYLIDSKAQRKVGINETIAVIAATSSAFGADVAGEGRFLVKLH